jgi:chromate transport protein ChrA
MDQGEQLKRWVGTHVALALLLLPGVCALPLLALIMPPSWAQALVIAVWALLALALVALGARVVLHLRRAAAVERRQREAADAGPER